MFWEILLELTILSDRPIKKWHFNFFHAKCTILSGVVFAFCRGGESLNFFNSHCNQFEFFVSIRFHYQRRPHLISQVIWCARSCSRLARALYPFQFCAKPLRDFVVHSCFNHIFNMIDKCVKDCFCGFLLYNGQLSYPLKLFS